jgi:hypothetical protein
MPTDEPAAIIPGDALSILSPVPWLGVGGEISFWNFKSMVARVTLAKNT